MSTLRGIHFGSYWMGENDIVFLMAQDLASMCDLTIVDVGIYDQCKSEWFEEDNRCGEKRLVRWLDHRRVLSVVAEQGADFVVVNAGGLSLRPETVEVLHKRNVVCLGISLSDPDVYPYNGKVYSHLYDLFYTNSLHSLTNEYGCGGNVKLLPFAASPRLHRPLPDVGKKYDVVVVGHARADRMETVEMLKKDFTVGLFGRGWGRDHCPVNGVEHVKAINSGRAYLSFSRTAAGFDNVKVGIFEAAACNTLLITQFFDEMSRYFKYGAEIVGYSQVEELAEILNFYLKNEPVRNWFAQNAYETCLREHTWSSRWKEVLDDVERARRSGRCRIDAVSRRQRSFAHRQIVSASEESL
jgi:spore maturation protein CgeB